MDKFEFTVTGTDQLRKNIQRFGQVAIHEIGSALFLEGERIMNDAKEHFVPVDLSVLRASGRVEFPVYTATSVDITLGFGGAASGYAIYVHEGTGPAVGRRAFMPPVAPFRAWAKRKFGDESLGFVIARAVGRKGLKPRRYLSTPLLNAIPSMDQRIASEVQRRLERFNAD